jgi:membrane-associated phospholipid phosphatase
VFDQRVLRFAADIAMPWAIDVAKVVSALGSLPAVIALVVVTSALLLWRGEIRPVIALVAGLALTYVLVHVLKDAYDRPRPASAVGESAGSSFPSAHAAYAVAWVACAVALTRALPGIGTRFAFVTVGVVVAALVGLSRVYLRVHWLSDVLAGWGLGATVFALCGIVALVVGFVRQNGAAAPPARAGERVGT